MGRGTKMGTVEEIGEGKARQDGCGREKRLGKEGKKEGGVE